MPKPHPRELPLISCSSKEEEELEDYGKRGDLQRGIELDVVAGFVKKCKGSEEGIEGFGIRADHLRQFC